MHWLVDNWQSAAALGIVALTVVIFALRLVRPKKPAGGCGAGCGCGGKVESRKVESRKS